MIENINEVREFLKKYPDPKLEEVVTVAEGRVVCIRPVPTICGPELHAAGKTMRELWKEINGWG